MRLKYQKSKGGRIKKGYYKYKGKCLRNFIHVEVDGMTFIHPQKVWVSDLILSKIEYKWRSTCANCGSVKAYKRMIRKNNIPKGKSTLVSRFKGYNVWY